MRVTKEDVDELASRRGRRSDLTAQPSAPVKEGWDGGVLTVWVPGRPSNPLNGSHAHWSKRARWAKQWRERGATVLLKHRRNDDPHPRPFGWRREEPKRVTFTIYGAARFDDDNVRAVVKPLRDSLQDMALIDSDGNRAHQFLYEQAKPTRKAGAVHGIAIRVEVLK